MLFVMSLGRNFRRDVEQRVHVVDLAGALELRAEPMPCRG